MDDTNEMFIRIKAHLFILNNPNQSVNLNVSRFPKPTVEELDRLMLELFAVLRKDTEPMIKH